MNRPNIIFYFSDQQRWDTLGCYGQKLDVTPNLDRLAAEGVLFENAFTCQPVCGPARACLQTGRYATQVGCHTNARALPFGKIKTLAQYFNDAGYDTAYVGKWHLASDAYKGENFETCAIPQERRGGYKDYWMASDVLEFTSHGYNGYVYNGANEKVEFTGYRADCINNYAIDYVRNYDKDHPFFLFISQIEPHHQNDHRRFEGPDGSYARFSGFETPGDLEDCHGKGDWEKNYPDYLGCCHSLDANVGRLVDTLKEKGMWDNTILFYTSDHGSHFRTRNSEYKRSCHEASIHIPLIAIGPGFEGGKREKHVVSLIDLPTTLLDCAGIARPEGFCGRSLRTLMRGDVPAWDDTAFLQISEAQVGRAIRTPKWKYSVRAEGNGWDTAGADAYYEEFLYDLEADPFEKNNLAADPGYAEVRSQLAKQLCVKMAEAGEEVPEIRPYKEWP